MAKKINGYARDNYGVIEFVELGKPEEGAWHEATLVVGKERVFTETEVRAAAMAEPELPGNMPDEMWEACRSDRATMQEAMRVVVRLTRDGILERIGITL